ncbi:hypothetical protein [Dyella sp. Tek66A03]|uniref:hypothetical protein n=1 Tax=Dyella sp. Tek66A03 TaxID=3458298 RepID=UPI00403EA5A4
MKLKNTVLPAAMNATSADPVAAHVAAITMGADPAVALSVCEMPAREVHAVTNPVDSGTLISATAIDDLDPVLASVAAKANRITYQSYSLGGSAIVVSGAILVPKGRPPKGGGAGGLLGAWFIRNL